MTYTGPGGSPEHTLLAFNGLGISPGLMAVLRKRNFTTPTPIQLQAIPPALEGKDVIGVAQTGTGKTLAFGIPLIQKLSQGNAQGLVLVPTRELALQADEELRKIGSDARIRTAILIGGSSMGQQIRALRNSPHIIIATPGRLNDHIEHKTVRLNLIEILVIDEADRMLDMGFWPQVKRIISAIPPERQTLLFSATLSNEIMDLASKHMRLPTSIEVTPPGTTVDKVSQELFMVRKEDKMRLLEKVLRERKGSVIVFIRTKYAAAKTARAVRNMGHTAVEIHSNRSLGQRKDALEGFKSGRYRVLVATDIAARGIDIKGIELVVNFDLPSKSEDYVHRIGRTARAGAAGHAISFATPDQRRDIRDIENLIRKSIPTSSPLGSVPAEMSRHAPRPQTSHGRAGNKPPFRKKIDSRKRSNSNFRTQRFH